jgi:hypothetical protein
MNTDAFSRRVGITTDMFDGSFKLDSQSKLQLFAKSGFRYIHWCDDWYSEVIYTKDQMKLIAGSSIPLA